MASKTGETTAGVAGEIAALGSPAGHAGDYIEGLIVLRQIPVIEESLLEAKARIDERLAFVKTLDVSEETVKEIKRLRAELNKELGIYEERRKAIKKAVMEPYERIEAVYAECVAQPYKGAIEYLDGQAKAIDNAAKLRKHEEVEAYFKEYALARGIDFLSMERWGAKATLTATATAMKKEAKAYIDRVRGDLDMIEALEHKDEVLVEYRRGLDASAAVQTVAQRHRLLEAERADREAREARRAAEDEAAARVEAAMPGPPQPLAPAVVAPAPAAGTDDDQVLRVTFRIVAKGGEPRDIKGDMIGSLPELREYKRTMQEGGYEFE